MLKIARNKLASICRIPLDLLKQKQYLLSCFLLMATFSFSQDIDINFGKVQHSDIAMAEYTPEPDASAVILAKTKSLEYQTKPAIKQVIKHFERIKILKESAFDLGEVVIEYYHAEDLETIEQIQAMITYPDGRMLELDGQHATVAKIDKEWAQVILKFPNLVKGCIIEYEYILKKDYFSEPEDFVFQSEIPIRYASFSYVIPETINYIFFAQGEKFIEIGENEFTMINVPSIHEGAFITIMDDYIGKIETRIENYFDPYLGIQIVNPKVEVMAKRLMNDRLFGHQFSKDIYTRKITSAAKGVLDKDLPIIEKIDKLQAFILAHVSWDGTMELKCRKPIYKLFQDGKAGSTELNMMLLALLKYLDIKAYPVLISTRSNGQAYSSFPLESDFNYTAVLAEINGSMMLFDLSDELKPPSLLNFQALNQYGLVLKDDEPFWVKPSPNLTMDIFLAEMKLESNELIGKFSSKHNNYSGYLERDYTRDKNFLEHWKTAFQKRFPRAHIYDGSFENLDQINEEFKQAFSLEIPGAVESRSDTIFVTPFLFGPYDENLLY